MAFTSVLFLLFLSIVCAISYMLPRRARYIWLLVCSYAFYLYASSDMPSGISYNLPADIPGLLLGGAPQLGLLVGTTVFCYALALGIGAAQKRWLRRGLFILALVVLVGMLCAFKYLRFTVLLGGQSYSFDPAMPLGLSYFTLQIVSYMAEVYTSRLPAEKNPLRLALYVSFFPGIVVGPINRAAQMLPQYTEPARFEYDRVAGGLFRVVWGIFKKVVIADNLGAFVAGIFSVPAVHGGPMLVAAALAFAYQLYADFSGSCDIAIGAARMLGFDFMENFKRPFAARTYNELWKRWHISLTSFFRDYVYIPLGGNRKGQLRRILNVMVVFLVSGMWHGATWHFAVWGGINGLVVLGCMLLGPKKDALVEKIPVYRSRWLRGPVQRILVYLIFALCFTFFAFGLYSTPIATWAANLSGGWGALAEQGGLMLLLSSSGLTAQMLLVLGVSILGVELAEQFGISKTSNISDWIRRRRFFVRWPVYLAVLGVLLCFGAFGGSSFIYGQF